MQLRLKDKLLQISNVKKYFRENKNHNSFFAQSQLEKEHDMLTNAFVAFLQ